MIAILRLKKFAKPIGLAILFLPFFYYTFHNAYTLVKNALHKNNQTVYTSPT